MRRGIALALVLLGGCLDRTATVCGDGRVCAPGTVCVEALDLCAEPDQVTACAGLADGAACATETIADGSCREGACLLAGCGNGVTETGELCDDGNVRSDDGCSADCRSDETCGNGVVDHDEQCDCGVEGAVSVACLGPNSTVGGLCRLDCALHCGDGLIAATEACDPAAAARVSCAGATYDRGLTTCSAACEPVVSDDACGYLGWRTTFTIGDTGIVDLAPLAVDVGFVINADNQIAPYDDTGATQPSYAAAVTMSAIWAADTDAAFAVGAAGTIVRFDGVAWTEDASGTTADLHDVRGRTASDVYAVGDAGTVRHWDGAAWTAMDAPVATALRRVAVDATRVIVVGDDGTLVVHDGAWQVVDTQTTADLLGVATLAGTSVAVGAGGTILVDDGAGWTAATTTATADLRGVYGHAVDGWFAGGDAGVLLARDADVWRPLSLGRGVSGSVGQTFVELGSTSDIRVSALGTEDIVSFEGAAWSRVAVPVVDTILAIWGSSSRDVFAVGRNGAILHHDGLTWTAQASGTGVDLRGVWGAAPDDVYAVGDAGTVLHFDGDAWTTVRTGDEPLAGVFAAPGLVLVLAPTGVHRLEGASLVVDQVMDARAVWGSSATDVWVVGDRLRHWDGVAWSGPSTTVDLHAVSGSGATSLFALGGPGAYYDGAWHNGPLADPDLTAVAGFPGRPELGVFAAGRGGELVHFDGTFLEPMIGRTQADVTALFAIDGTLFVGGTDGVLDILVFRR